MSDAQGSPRTVGIYAVRDFLTARLVDEGRATEDAERWADELLEDVAGLAPTEVEDHSEIRTLAELLKDPDLLRPPQAVAPRFAWRGRSTLLAMREKGGKSTTASAIAAKVSSGQELLDVVCEKGTVLWLALEEHPADLARKLVGFGADPERVYIVDRLRSPMLDLQEAVKAVRPVLVVVDTLPAFAGLMEHGPEPGSSSDWTPVMAGLSDIARRSDAALLLLHHANKAQGRYRDSTAIGAGVDAIIEMREDVDHPGVRKVETRARWKVGPWSYRLEGDPMDPFSSPRLVLVEGGPTVREQVIAYVNANPGASTRDVRQVVTASSKAVGEAIDKLLRDRIIVDLGDSSTGRRLHPPEKPHRTAPEPVENHPGTAPGAKVVPGGDTLRSSVPPEPPPLGTTSADSGNRCACGSPIGPSVDQCAKCRYGGGS